MHIHRQQRLRVLEAIDERVKGFRRREELWPLRVPHEPLSLDDLVRRTLPDDSRGFDPVSIRSRTLLSLTWEDGSTWELWMAALPSGLKVYGDSGADETRLLASGGRNEGDDSDRALLELLGESAGRHFGIEMSGGAPTRVRASIEDRDFLVEFFVNLFEMAGTEDSVRAQLAGDRDMDAGAADFRTDVERWLVAALRARRSR